MISRETYQKKEPVGFVSGLMQLAMVLAVIAIGLTKCWAQDRQVSDVVNFEIYKRAMHRRGSIKLHPNQVLLNERARDEVGVSSHQLQRYKNSGKKEWARYNDLDTTVYEKDLPPIPNPPIKNYLERPPGEAGLIWDKMMLQVAEAQTARDKVRETLEKAKNNESQKLLEDFHRLKFESFSNVFSTEQKKRIGELLIQKDLNYLQQPCSYYNNVRLAEWLQIERRDHEKLAARATAERKKLDVRIEALLQKYHLKVCQNLSAEKRRAVAAIFSDQPARLPNNSQKFVDRVFDSQLKTNHRWNQKTAPFVSVDLLRLHENKYPGLKRRLAIAPAQLEQVAQVVAELDLARIAHRRQFYSLKLENVQRAIWKREKEKEENGKLRIDLTEEMKIGEEKFANWCDKHFLIEDDARKKISNLLLPHQKQEIVKYVLEQGSLSKGWPFGMYQSEKFVNTFEIEPDESKSLEAVAKQLKPRFEKELKEIISKSHKHIRAELSEKQKSRLEEVFGEPFYWTIYRK